LRDRAAIFLGGGEVVDTKARLAQIGLDLSVGVVCRREVPSDQRRDDGPFDLSDEMQGRRRCGAKLPIDLFGKPFCLGHLEVVGRERDVVSGHIAVDARQRLPVAGPRGANADPRHRQTVTLDLVA
jgi:hypothetical protein